MMSGRKSKPRRPSWPIFEQQKRLLPAQSKKREQEEEEESSEEDAAVEERQKYTVEQPCWAPCCLCQDRRNESQKDGAFREQIEQAKQNQNDTLELVRPRTSSKLFVSNTSIEPYKAASKLNYDREEEGDDDGAQSNTILGWQINPLPNELSFALESVRRVSHQLKPAIEFWNVCARRTKPSIDRAVAYSRRLLADRPYRRAMLARAILRYHMVAIGAQLALMFTFVYRCAKMWLARRETAIIFDDIILDSSGENGEPDRYRKRIDAIDDDVTEEAAIVTRIAALIGQYEQIDRLNRYHRRRRRRRGFYRADFQIGRRNKLLDLEDDAEEDEQDDDEDEDDYRTRYDAIARIGATSSRRHSRLFAAIDELRCALENQRSRLIDCDHRFEATGLGAISASSGVDLLVELIRDRCDAIDRDLADLRDNECRLRRVTDSMRELERRSDRLLAAAVQYANCHEFDDDYYHNALDDDEDDLNDDLEPKNIATRVVRNLISTADGWRSMAASYLKIL